LGLELSILKHAAPYECTVAHRDAGSVGSQGRVEVQLARESTVPKRTPAWHTAIRHHEVGQHYVVVLVRGARISFHSSRNGQGVSQEKLVTDGVEETTQGFAQSLIPLGGPHCAWDTLSTPGSAQLASYVLDQNKLRIANQALVQMA
jgi:hypothetical protein